MKRINWTVFFLIVLFSCGPKNGFKESEDGIIYKIIESTGGEQVELEDYIELNVKYFTESDSMLFNSESMPGKYRIKLRKSRKTTIDDAIAMLAVGDSAHFLLDAKTFYMVSRRESLPSFIDSESKLRFEMRVIGKVTEAQLVEEKKALEEKRKTDELDMLEQYVADNYPKAVQSITGLYTVVNEKGNGKQVTAGKTVTVHYTGKLLNGKVFDSSVTRGQPFQFPVGARRVIAGWEEGVNGTNVGDKITLLIPSHLGYGARGAGANIPPYSSLIFDIEVLAVQ